MEKPTKFSGSYRDEQKGSGPAQHAHAIQAGADPRDDFRIDD